MTRMPSLDVSEGSWVSEGSNMRRTCVLIVCSKPSDASIYASVLGPMGVDAVFVSSAAELVACATRSQCIGIFLNDIAQRGGCREVLQIARDTPELERTPIIFITAS